MPLSGLKKCTHAFVWRVSVTCFLGWGNPGFFFFFAFVFDELVGVCFCLYSGTSM